MITIPSDQRNTMYSLAGIVIIALLFASSLFIYNVLAQDVLDTNDVRVYFASSSDTMLWSRIWDNSASAWTSATTTLNASATIYYVESKNHPTSTEELVGVLASTTVGNLNMLRFDGTNWTVDWTSVSTTVANIGKRSFDLEYEAQSGDAIAVYSNNTTNPVYRTFTGGSWSAEANVFASVPGSGVVQWVELARRPGSNEIALVYADANSDLFTVIWDGSSWDEAGTETTLETGLAQTTYKTFDAVYESVSGDLLIAWVNTARAVSASKNAGSNTFTTTSITTAGTNYLLELAAEPGTNRVVFGAMMSTNSARGGIWTGSQWIDVKDVHSTASVAPNAGEFTIDAVWVGYSGTAMISLRENGGTNRFDYARWTLPSGWSVGSTYGGCSNNNHVSSMRLESFASVNRVAITMIDGTQNLCSAIWNGSSWTTSSLRFASSSVITALPFSMSAEPSPSGTLFLTDYSVGQERDAFSESGSVTNAELFRFSMGIDIGSASVSQLVFTIATSSGLVDGDFSGIELLEDANADGDIGAGETTAVGGAGTVSISGGTITFSSGFTVTTTKNIVLRADFASLQSSDRLVVNLASSSITATNATIASNGTTTSATHQEGLPTLAIDDARVYYGPRTRTSVSPDLAVRTWDDSSSTLVAESIASLVTSSIRYTINKLHPTTTEELIGVLTQPTSGSSTLWLIRWTGSVWSIDASSTPITNANGVKRGFDLDYEAQSGDAMIVYSNNTTNPVYRTRSAGGNWSTEASILSTPPGSGVVEWVELTRRPGSNEIALVYADANSDLFTVIWNGSSWDEATTENTLETGLAQTTIKTFDAVYEQLSGDLLIAWVNTARVVSASKPASTSTFSTTSIVTASTNHAVSLGAEPGGNRAIIGMKVGSTDVRGAVWDGTAWVNEQSLNFATANIGSGDAPVQAAWVGNSSSAVVFYDLNQSNRVDYARWTTGSGWGSATFFTGCITGQTVESLQAEAFTDQGKVMLLFSGSSEYLCAATYNGTSVTLANGGNPILTTSTLSSTTSVPFSLSL